MKNLTKPDYLKKSVQWAGFLILGFLLISPFMVFSRPAFAEINEEENAAKPPEEKLPNGVVFLSPRNGSGVSGSVQITAQVLEGQTTAYLYADDQLISQQPVPEGKSVIIEFACDTKGLTNGTHVLTIKAEDEKRLGASSITLKTQN